jgi:hypothetical protein
MERDFQAIATTGKPATLKKGAPATANSELP